MNREELRNRLKEMSESELRHKKDPERGLKLYENFNRVNHESKEPIYIFDFDTDLNRISYRNTKFPRNSDHSDLNLQLAITQHSRYSKLPIHIHNYVEMNYVYTGQCKQLINGKLVTLQEGDICILDTNVPHTILETTENDIIINFIMLKPFFTTSFLSRLAGTGIISNFLVNAISQTQNHNRYIIFQTGNNISFKEMMENLMCEFFNPQICSKEIIESYMVIVFSELIRTFQKNQAKDYNASSNTDLVNILKYLEDNYKDCTLNSRQSILIFIPTILRLF
ncbi:cupin domain-containing protein [Neobacillus cucumis]|uniref:cupin domain-containing protein n=1 Tax=Neobacillus cucumis TaxID=1740721 RepID=UPI001EF97389|nr:cupin domain-containing protein [Neobacillus cucumis]MBM7654637.1 mannose-6-phosphate isomerase-like protein (cupin superfamily) [Neobacillus cucumis]